MLRALALAGICVMLAGFALSPSMPPLSLGARLAAPGGTSPLVPSARIDALLARLPHRQGTAPGSDGVALHWVAFDPGDYRLDYRYLGKGERFPEFALDANAPTATAPAPRGTVILLHGWMMDGGSLLPWALQLAQGGYRTIALDLRNHGRSGQAPSGYGTREGEDVAAVLHALGAAGEIDGPVHLLGVSYGAATAIFAARELGPRLRSVVAMESFDNAGHAIRTMVPHLLSKPPERLGDYLALPLARWQYGGSGLDAAIADADRRLGLDLDRVDVAQALAQVPACVLLLHGRDDAHIPVAQGRALAAAAPRARYLELEGEDHLTLPLRLDRLSGVIDSWLAQAGSDEAHCPMPTAPAAGAV
ncbi:alpha/beta fold hydrolase [Flavobacterium sp. MXW15]|uniref:Alpha/beta fold hydrolase n=1 Tax=Xanthomonas chitinilytica TaxID=2989819 RepID=A0ABT3K044_9XANT|nr:alpha/beta fold hydrolase [Xanthomonas sp. H13-6]MCW4456384.1 alpha/beta fold hydrolase [Flavobacterium sp. MXW15]MCW4474089.1 alpha/beta fold hydrolase [Xanthomonas sp. H13-6]